MNKRLQEIFDQNVKWEKESPYNFCDRWCERCPVGTQLRCTLYKNELEQRMTCIAHGKEEDDPEITEAVMKQQFEVNEEKIEEFMVEDEGDLEEIDSEAFEAPEFEPIKKHMDFVRNHPLPLTADQYRERVRAFLKKAFYPKQDLSPELRYDFETVAWYHTLLPAKLNRALAGFHEPMAEGEIALYDAVAQIQVCKKAVRESILAFRNLDKRLLSFHSETVEVLALLNNLQSRIQALEDEIK